MHLLSGVQLSESIKQDINKKINELGKRPQLCVILIGDNKQSEIYVRIKKNACEKVGIKFTLVKFDEGITEIFVINKIIEFNENPDVHGILVQLPIPSHLSKNNIIESISVNKDVDCLTTYNLGKIVSSHEPVFIPCTAKGVIRLLDSYNINLSGRSVVIVGRSLIVGLPLFHLLLNRNATVTVCHSKTNNLEQITKQADIVIVAIGIPNYVKSNWLKQDAIVIDVGINKIGDKIVGDVDFESCSNVASHITPVPGGVGPMTIAMVLENTLASYENQ